MSKTLCCLRLEKDKLQRLKNIASQNNQKYTDLIRDKINEIFTNDLTEDQKYRARKIVLELRGPFAFVKTPIGEERARRERELRGDIALRIEKAFCLK